MHATKPLSEFNAAWKYFFWCDINRLILTNTLSKILNYFFHIPVRKNLFLPQNSTPPFNFSLKMYKKWAHECCMIKIGTNYDDILSNLAAVYLRSSLEIFRKPKRDVLSLFPLLHNLTAASLFAHYFPFSLFSFISPRHFPLLSRLDLCFLLFA